MATMDPTLAKKAVDAALAYLRTVSPNFSTFSNFRLEEINLDKDSNFLITISYEVQGQFAFDLKREYKDFIVDKIGENVVSMKIRRI